MNIHSDFEEFLRLLNEAGVRFVIVGGYAVAFHGYVRATADLDVFIEATESNAAAVRKALIAFGFSEAAVSGTSFVKQGNIVRIGVPPVRIEIINRISGLTFEEVWDRHLEGKYGKVEVSFIGLEDLIKNKTAAARPKDLADVAELSRQNNKGELS